MGLYDVVEPCTAADVQYVRPTAEFQPVEVDDEVAKPLVAEGKLTHYAPGADVPAVEGATGTLLTGAITEVAPTARAKRPRRGDDED